MNLTNLTNSFIIIATSSAPHVKPPVQNGIGAIKSPIDVLYMIGVLLIPVVFMVVFCFCILAATSWREMAKGKDVPRLTKTLTPTQKYILAASCPTIGNQYKCVIDIWDTRESDAGVEQAIKLFEWGWGEFTYENAKNMAEECLNSGHNVKFKEYCNADASSPENTSKYTSFELQLLEEMKQRYPKQGMLAWDLVRTLSIVGGAYMGGIMEYEEAVKIAFEVCKRLQENFSSWDDMVGSYTLGYQFWRGKKKTDRLNYYKRIKKSWIYKIAWDTQLKESELGVS